MTFSPWFISFLQVAAVVFVGLVILSFLVAFLFMWVIHRNHTRIQRRRRRALRKAARQRERWQ